MANIRKKKSAKKRAKKGPAFSVIKLSGDLTNMVGTVSKISGVGVEDVVAVFIAMGAIWTMKNSPEFQGRRRNG